MGGISNLLASIHGDKPVPPPSKPSPNLSRHTLPPLKRKADSDLRDDGIKRRSPNPAGLVSTTKVTAKPADKTTSAPKRPNIPRQPERLGPSHKTSTASLSKSIPPKTNGSGQRSVPPSRPDGNKWANEPAPKKGSFKEIMARAERAREKFGQIGKIQHKKLERAPNRQEKEDTKVETQPLPKRAGTTRPGTARPGATSLGKFDGKSHLDPRGAAVKGASNHKTSSKEKALTKDEAEQAQKKRRTAPSTGYSGTARPKPATQSSSSSKPKSAAPTGGVLLNSNPKLSRYSGSRRSRYEGEDDDMSDFIDDEEEPTAEDEGLGRRYQYYDSDGSSDMEAGMDMIDEEEELSAFQARRDDAAELALEKRLKEEKERRKRGAVVATHSRR